MSTTNNNSRLHSPANNTPNQSQDQLDDEPPPYTPAVDVYQGERVLEVGPSAPFRRPQQVPLHLQPTPYPPASHSTGHLPQNWTGSSSSRQSSSTNNHTQPTRSLLRQITGQIVNSFEEYSRERDRSRHSSPPTLGVPRRVPPPLQPPTLPPRRHSSNNSVPQESRSEFARDFYAAGAGGIDGAQESTNTPVQVTPPTPPPRDTSPPRPNDTFDTSDARPTTTPIPGRPLLNGGRLLVYPAGHWCDRCQNTGYKKGQPSKPCNKCWNKYAKPYTGALAYAPSANSSDGPSDSTSFQRPLPAVTPEPSSVWRQATLQRARSQSHTASSSMPPGALHRARTGAGYAPQYTVSTPTISNNYGYMNRGPMYPNTIVVRPGDVRLGGQLCWKCSGTGVKPSLTGFFLGSEETCYICGGVGRIRS